MCTRINLTLFIPVKLTELVSNKKDDLVPFLKQNCHKLRYI